MTDKKRAQPQREWYVVALSKRVTRSPISVRLLDRTYVLYRDVAGSPVAHQDRCPHRNVALSKGRCLKDNTLECAYHGWSFSPEGQCVSIPGLTSLPKASHRVPTFATIDERGFIWLCPDEAGRAPLRKPFFVPEWLDEKYLRLARQVEFPAGMHAVVENALDVPHTSILHRGAFRAGSRNRIRVVMRRFRSWVEAEYIGEPPPTGLVARVLALGAKNELTVQHWDRFILPSILQVEYRLGARTHFLITGFCSPQSPDSTRVFVQACIRTPLSNWLVRPFLPLVEKLAMHVYRQDVEILRSQSRGVQEAGAESFISTEIDVLGGAVTRLIKDARELEARSDQLAEGSDEGVPPARHLEELREEKELELDA